MVILVCAILLATQLLCTLLQLVPPFSSELSNPSRAAERAFVSYSSVESDFSLLERSSEEDSERERRPLLLPHSDPQCFLSPFPFYPSSTNDFQLNEVLP